MLDLIENQYFTEEKYLDYIKNSIQNEPYTSPKAQKLDPNNKNYKSCAELEIVREEMSKKFNTDIIEPTTSPIPANLRNPKNTNNYKTFTDNLSNGSKLSPLKFEKNKTLNPISENAGLTPEASETTEIPTNTNKSRNMIIFSNWTSTPRSCKTCYMKTIGLKPEFVEKRKSNNNISCSVFFSKNKPSNRKKQKKDK